MAGVEANVATRATGIARNVKDAGGVGGAYHLAELAELVLYSKLADDVDEAIAAATVGAHLYGQAGEGLAVKVEREVHGVAGQEGDIVRGVSLTVEGEEPRGIVGTQAPFSQGIDAVLVVVVEAHLLYLLAVYLGKVGVVFIGAVDDAGIGQVLVEEVFFQPMILVYGVEAKGDLYIVHTTGTAVEFGKVFKVQLAGLFYEYAVQPFEGLELFRVVQTAEDDLRAVLFMGEYAVGLVEGEAIVQAQLSYAGAKGGDDRVAQGRAYFADDEGFQRAGVCYDNFLLCGAETLAATRASVVDHKAGGALP